MPAKQYYVYILTNKAKTVLYTGITNDIEKRLWEHRAGIGSKFTLKYRLKKLVYLEVFKIPTKPSPGRSRSKQDQGRGRSS